MTKLTTTDKIPLCILIALNWLRGDLLAVGPVGIRLQKSIFLCSEHEKNPLIFIDGILEADTYLPVKSMKVGNALLYPDYVF